MANQERFYLLKQGSSAEMPRDIHILMQGQTVWNTWRRRNATRSLETGEIIRFPLADLSGADLSGTNLHGFDFIHTLLSGANLSNSDLSEAILSYADLGNADLSGANLRRADLSYAHLSGANLSGADLSGADLNSANLAEHHFSFPDLDNRGEKIEVTLSRANLSGANLSGANLSRAALSGADFSKFNLSEIDLSGAYLTEANLSGADLSGADLRGTHLTKADLTGANLIGANLSGTGLSQTKLTGANLNRADLSYADLSGVNLSDFKLTEADLSGANLSGAILSRADLSGTNLSGADLSKFDFSRANLNGANLIRTILIETNFEHAVLTNCLIYGIAVWNVQLENAEQKDLVITPTNESTITVDSLEVAQFVYLLLNNAKIRDVINTLTTKAVLILGRFTPERKAILDALREALRTHGYLPILFDFEKPGSRNLTETVSTLAHLARFIIADLTDPSSIPQELQAIVPTLAVPVRPVLLEGKKEYAMSIDLLSTYHWMLPIHFYKDKADLLATLQEDVIEPAEHKAQELEKR